ncbi:MAG: hypothetical protein ACXWC9_10585 [Pseudobdellovibrionaceae bacterium]
MKILSILTLLMSFSSFAAEPTKPAAPAKPKSQFNSQVYEQSDSVEAFSAVVKVMREVQGEIEVFFEGKQGFYVLGEASLQERLVKSQTKKLPLRIEVETGSRKILKAEFQH